MSVDRLSVTCIYPGKIAGVFPDFSLYLLIDHNVLIGMQQFYSILLQYCIVAARTT